MKKLPLSLFLSLALCLSMYAGEIYVFHDSSCMDKLSFKEKTLTADFKLKTSSKLISYNIRANENEYIRLEVGTDGDELRSDMPINTKNCNELIWDEQFVKEINALSTDIYIVSLEDGKYRVSPVSSASYFFSSEDEMAFSNEYFGFNFDLGAFDSNEDLLTFGLKSKVKFSFADNMHCPGEYHFYKSTKGRNLSENELVIVPHLGVVKNYTVSKKLNRNLRELELQTVNDMPLSTFLEQMCNKTTVAMEATSEKTEMSSTEIDMVAKSGEKMNKAPLTKAQEMDATMASKSKVATLPMVTLPGAKTATGAIQTCPHIYRNADTGFYYDRNTGLHAEGDCGGITYISGKMQNSDYQTTNSTTARVSNAPIEDEFTAKGEQTISAEGAIKSTDIATEATLSEVETTKTMMAETTEVAPAQKEIATTQKTKVVYKEPKIIYKESTPIVIDASIEPQDTKILISKTNNRVASNIDCTTAPRTGYHMVKKGETLYGLSNKYNISIENLLQWNGLSSSEISVCSHLRVQPEISLSQSKTNIPANEFVSKGGNKSTLVTPVPVKRQYHYIAQGETLYSISQKHQVSVMKLKKLNKLNDDYLKPGWRLLIPNSSDNVNEIAIPKATPKVIPSAEYTPKGGSSMKIPDSSENLLNTYQNQHIYHTVGQDEAISDIALKYGVSINMIKVLNEMSEGEVLIPFQKIKVR